MTRVVLLLVALLLGADGAENIRFSFEDPEVGKLPEGWTAAKTGEGKGSVWKIANDSTAPNGPQVMAQTSSEGPSALFNLCVLEEVTRADVDLTVAFKAVLGKIDMGGGLLWRYKDANNYYIARQNPLEENFRVYKVVAGKRTQLATANVDAPSGKWHTIRIIHKGDHIQCYLNDKLHLDVKDDAFNDAGKIGLWTKADAVTYFDDFKVGGPD
jgi:hypothetical protein